MQRLSPTVLAAIALGALVLLILGFVLFQGGSAEDDRLTGDEVAAARQTPEERCADAQVHDRIKGALFRDAGALRGNDQETLDKIAAYASLRVEAPVMRDENPTANSVTCNGTVTLNLPEGVAVAGGRRSLTADILYTVETTADGAVSVTLADAENIVTPLSTIGKVQEQPAGDELTNAADGAVTDPLAPTEEPPAPADPLAPQPAPTASAQPSFNCSNARSPGEIAVCEDERLAALDRRMAAQYRAALADASPAQRAVLQQTRDAFLRYRDGCPENSCIAETYQGRIREIRDIMMGTYRPRR